MSELTKLAVILLKNLSDALLTTASEINKLNSISPLSQADEKPKFVSLGPHTFTKREIYKKGDRVMVMLDGAMLPIIMRVSGVPKEGLYLAYFPSHPPSSAREITDKQILGLDPNR